MFKIVVDTNVLINGFKDSHSYEARIIEAVLNDQLQVMASRKIKRENRLILYRLITDEEYQQRIEDFLERVDEIRPGRSRRLVEADQEDSKFVDVALVGKADFVVSSDRHLLDLGEIEGVRFIRPAEMVAELEKADGTRAKKFGSWVDQVV